MKESDIARLIEPYLSKGILKKDTCLCRVQKGGLNYVFFLHDGSSSYVLKALLPEKEREYTLKNLDREYRSIGFAGSWSSRSIGQQSEMEHSLASGFPVLENISCTDDSILYPMVDAEKYSVALSCASPKRARKIAGDYLELLSYSHSKGVVFGDRWAQNEFLTEKGLLLFDLDISLDIGGRGDFELTQAIYYSVLNAGHKGDLTDHMGTLMGSRRFWHHDYRTIVHFLEGHSVFFNGKEDGGIDRHVDICISKIKKIYNR